VGQEDRSAIIRTPAHLYPPFRWFVNDLLRRINVSLSLKTRLGVVDEHCAYLLYWPQHVVRSAFACGMILSVAGAENEGLYRIVGVFSAVPFRDGAGTKTLGAAPAHLYHTRFTPLRAYRGAPRSSASTVVIYRLCCVNSAPRWTFCCCCDLPPCCFLFRYLRIRTARRRGLFMLPVPLCLHSAVAAKHLVEPSTGLGTISTHTA